MEDFKPYLEDLKASISSQTKLLELLEDSIILNDALTLIIIKEQAKTEPKTKGFIENSLFIVNSKISKIKITSEIETLKKIIDEKMDYFEKFAKQFDVEYKECLENFDKVIERANKLAFKKPQLKWLLSKQTQELLENKEAHLYFYKKVKAFLN
jgi:hypothetical protein